MTSDRFAGLAAFVVFMLGAGYYLGWHRELVASLPSVPTPALFSTPPPEPVLILLVGSDESVDRVRDAVDPERIVASTPHAFAVVDGHIVAADAEAASAPLNAAGWSDRPIEILGAERVTGSPDAQAGASHVPDAPPPLAELAKKPTLTPGEAMRLLEHMN
jgi:hypothetical protein